MSIVISQANSELNEVRVSKITEQKSPETEFHLSLDNLVFITEVRPLKRVAREKWGTHDALRASRPGNEVVKAADVFGFL